MDKNRPSNRRPAAGAASATRLQALHGGRRSLVLCTLALAVTFVAYPQAAQAQLRTFPQNTKVGTLQMGNFPEAQIDGKRIQFSAGGRIMNENNMSVIPMSIERAVRIRYRLDGTGQVMMAWILTAQETEAAKADAASQRSGN